MEHLFFFKLDSQVPRTGRPISGRPSEYIEGLVGFRISLYSLPMQMNSRHERWIATVVHLLVAHGVFDEPSRPLRRLSLS